MTPTTIIGIGTARGGTQSLAHLLQEQGLDVTHEGTPSIDWRREVRERRVGGAQRHLEERDGDVSCWLISGASDLLDSLPGAVVVSVRRDKEDTVDSLTDTMKPRRVRESETFSGMPFPTYEGKPVQDAWETYWQDFRQRVGSLKSSYGERVLEVGLEDLESEETQEEIAEFLGIDDWTHVADCHIGQRR